MTSNSIGNDFEDQVAAVLDDLQVRHDDRVFVNVQPRLELYDGQCVIPDFELQVMLPFEDTRYLIECQKRKRSGPAIAQKIRYMKGLSARNTFIFVYGSKIPAATKNALTADGVIAVAFDEFVAFVARLEATLRETRRIARPKDRDIIDVFRRLLGGRDVDGFDDILRKFQ